MPERSAGAGEPGVAEDVVAAVVNYNTAALTRACTESLLASGVPQVLVLDNASSEADYRRLRG